ncbi:MAG TPA: HD domain-containing phosphohydrolase [Lachnospiraceae bacterium]|nr:HD domain-containing phosphohydrolase [Lachnospiraceae bacterium]
MKTIARMALEPGMVLSEDVLSAKGEIIVPAKSEVNDSVISKLTRYSIMVVSIMEEIDYATTHFEKIRLSDGFRLFEESYQTYFPLYKDMMNNLVENSVPVDTDELMDIYHKLTDPISSNKTRLDYLYNMISNEDELTHTHCFNSALIAGVFADWLGMKNDEKNLLILCAFFYDIGKLKLPNELLWKSEKLNDEEFAQIRTHPLLGYDIVKNQTNLDPHVLKCVVMHHERCDGQGYPSKLQMQQIDFYARHITIIDAYEAMTSPRVYRQSLTPLKVVERFDKTGMLQYDYDILHPIVTRIADSQIGLTVKLNDDSFWDIFLINQLCLSRPVLKNYIDEKKEYEFLDLMKRPDLEIMAIY